MIIFITIVHCYSYCLHIWIWGMYHHGWDSLCVCCLLFARRLPAKKLNTEARRACYRLGRRTRCRCERTPDRCSCTCRSSRGRCGFRTATRCCNRLRNTLTRTCPTKRLERRCTRFGHLGTVERRVRSDRFQRSRSSRTSASCRRTRWDGRAGGRCGCRTP